MLNTDPVIGAVPDGGICVGPAVAPGGTVVEVVVPAAPPEPPGVGPVTPWYPLTVTGPVSVRLVVADALSVTVRSDPTGTEPKSIEGAWIGAAADDPKAMRRPLRVPTKTRPSHAVGTENFDAAPIGADQSNGSTPLLGTAP
jgi:hypothetical protein